ncbi:CGNR zinc finger domain-containing protein [Desertihabitans brevis]|uniref:CGNR zinc finger domain-containing protein n=1 Tax=Desertihabitans brevis TaxID=2268447 RepID=UPI001F1F7D1D|nr:CGNR zinc finger domain-containing protein [Desertihabitans brevis]
MAIFAADTEVALACAAALITTAGDPDTLGTLDELADFVRRWGYTGRVTRTRAELDEVRALRPVLRELWQAEEDEAVALTNRLLADAGATPQLVRHDSWSWHLHATTPDAPLATRIAVETAMAFTDVIRSGELSRLRTCSGQGCDDPVLDLSKNRSRLYCDTSCANRTHVAAYRARQAGTA